MKYALRTIPDHGPPRVQAYPSKHALTAALLDLLAGPEFIDGPRRFHLERGASVECSVPLSDLVRTTDDYQLEPT